MCQILVYWMWKRGVDPDNAAIPYLTAVQFDILRYSINSSVTLPYLTAVQYNILRYTNNSSIFSILFHLQIGDLLGTSLLAMAFLALEEIGTLDNPPPGTHITTKT